MTDLTIRALDERTVQRIAAGEVVERPASVVKELVENSLDADADRIAVSVRRGGKDGVRVRDDGRGIPESELDRAVAEHTTSKIGDIEDLDAGVASLGFRGEALYTIGAVSRMTVRSRPPEADVGAELTVEGGDVGDVRPAGCPVGTTVEVEDLFFNTPAREKFLKTDATEFDHVNGVVTHYALANPDVAVSLEHDGREVFATEGSGDLQATVLAVYGREVAEAMVGVDAGGEADGPVESVHGLVSHPETTRSGREYLSTFVNGRYVTSSVLREAVLDAYGGQLAPDRYPFAVLFVDVPPESVDVNVHPRKMEVRFDDEAGTKRAVRDAVESALLEHGIVRRGAPRGRSAPDEADVRPDDGDGEVVGGAGHGAGGGGDDTEAKTHGDDTVDESAGESERTQARLGGEAAVDTDSDAGSDDSPSASQMGATPEASEDSHATPESSETTSSRPSPRSWQEGDDAGGETDDAGKDAEDAKTAAGHPHAESAESAERREFTPPSTQRALDGDAVETDFDFERLPAMRVLGQVQDTYLVCETDDGLVLVDQHAADERINYERLRETVRGDTPTQALAESVRVELTAREAALFDEYDDALAQVGFHASRVGERTVEVRTVPAVFDAALDPELLRDVVSGFVADGGDGEGGRETVDAVADDLLADLACYPSITGNTSLHEGSVRALLSALDDCENPFACPHGRPVVVSIPADEIEDRFERDYPGHGGRRAE